MIFQLVETCHHFRCASVNSFQFSNVFFEPWWIWLYAVLEMWSNISLVDHKEVSWIEIFEAAQPMYRLSTGCGSLRITSTWVRPQAICMSVTIEYLTIFCRCYVAMSQAVSTTSGLSVIGPSGAGKTETLRDMSRTIGKYFVMVGCSDQVNVRAIGRLIEGSAFTNLCSVICRWGWGSGPWVPNMKSNYRLTKLCVSLSSSDCHSFRERTGEVGVVGGWLMRRFGAGEIARNRSEIGVSIESYCSQLIPTDDVWLPDIFRYQTCVIKPEYIVLCIVANGAR